MKKKKPFWKIKLAICISTLFLFLSFRVPHSLNLLRKGDIL